MYNVLPESQISIKSKNQDTFNKKNKIYESKRIAMFKRGFNAFLNADDFEELIKVSKTIIEKYKVKKDDFVTQNF